MSAIYSLHAEHASLLQFVAACYRQEEGLFVDLKRLLDYFGR